MVDAMVSRARLRDLACLGRDRVPDAGGAGPRNPSAPRRRAVTDAASIADVPPPRPRATSSRPEDGDLVASTI